MLLALPNFSEIPVSLALDFFSFFRDLRHFQVQKCCLGA